MKHVTHMFAYTDSAVVFI